MRILLGFLIAGLAAEGCLLAAVVYMENRTWPRQTADVIVVLGAHVMPDGSLSTVLENRLKAAFAAYEAGDAPRVIVCGAQGDDEPMTEARAMADDLVARGVPAEAIWLDENSYNTVQNLQNAQTIMDAEGMETALIVTTNYHLPRALAICEDLDIEASGISATSAKTLGVRWKLRFRETLSWANYLLQSKLLKRI